MQVLKELMKDKLAHSANSQSQTHCLLQHSQNVAKLASKFAAKFGCKKHGEMVGLIHDIGKIDEHIQEIMRENDPNKKRLGIDHKTEAAIIAKQSGNYELSFVLFGHHSGLPDKDYLDGKMTQQSKHKIETLQQPRHVNNKKSLEMHIKMLHSCLVDADYIDTELHYRGTTPTIPKYSFSDMLAQLQKTIAEKSNNAKNVEIKTIRKQIYQSCLKNANKPRGFFKLSAPTGGGKTLSSMAFALRHAITHNIDRIIVAIPYTSIIEQTATQYREIFGKNLVCEHHSNSQDIRFASDPWQEPIIVTTTVQLFESIFSNKPGKCRKLHNIVNSVIIIDESQCLPPRLLTPIMETLQELQHNYNVTVLFSTATQPEFSIIKQSMPGISEIIKGLDLSFLKNRVQLHFQQLPQTLGDIAAQIEKNRQCLCIVNTKKDAKILYAELKNKQNAFHLSTDMCPAHRENVLNIIIDRLNKKLPCIVIATQLVECGVDFDFPIVFRAIAPLTSIIQAAGRCNREGLLRKGHLFVFSPIDGGLPQGEYTSGKEIAWNILQNNENILAKETIAKYYKLLDLAIDTETEEIQRYREAFAFDTLAKRFAMIPKSTQPAIVQYGNIEKDIKKIIDMDDDEKIPMKIWRKIMRHSVNFYHDEFAKPINMGSIIKINKDLALWKGGYCGIIGIEKDELSL